MGVLKILLILATIKIIESKLVDNLLIFTHPMGPSHLSVAFDLAERFNDSENIYDVRFPMVESVWNYKSRKDFKQYKFDATMKKSDEVKKYVDESAMKKSTDMFAVLKMIKDAVEILVLPCKQHETIFDPSNKRNLALIDVYSSGCFVVLAKRHNARIAYFTAATEPSLVSYLSGTPLPWYATSLATGDLRLNFRTRLVNFFGNTMFRVFLLQIPLAKWLCDGDDKNYKNFEESIVAVNLHKLTTFPLPRTHLIVDMGNLADKKIKPLDDVRLSFHNTFNIELFSESPKVD